MRVLLVLPAYNEAAAIKGTVQTILDTSFSKGLDVDYIVINDGSTDETERLCRESGIKCLSLVKNLGIGGAVQTGYLYAALNGYDIAVQFDGDGQHDIHSLEALIAPILEDRCDFVVGSRFLENSSAFRSTWLRRAGIHYLSFVLRLVTSQRIADVTSGYRAANRRALLYLAENYPVDYPEPESLVHLYKQRLRIGEVSVNMFERTAGKSSIHGLRSVYYMIKVTLAVLFAAMGKGELK